MVDKFLELTEGKKMVAFTGSGASAESGIPTFRGRGGLWEKYDPRIYATLPTAFYAFLKEPQKIADFLIDSYTTFVKAEPNATHWALAKFEEEGRLTGVITQNIDNLHQFAGSQNVAELHGNAYRFYCRRCGYTYTKSKAEIRDFIEDLKKRKYSKRELKRKILFFQGKCKCKKTLVTSVIFFGQPLPSSEFAKAYSFIEKAEVFLCIGTSGMVMPAAMFPLHAKDSGCTFIEINPEPSEVSSLADLRITEPSSSFFSKLL